MQIRKTAFAVIVITVSASVSYQMVEMIGRTSAGDKLPRQTKTLMGFIRNATAEHKANSAAHHSDYQSQVDDWFKNHCERSELGEIEEMWRQRVDAWGNPLCFESDSTGKQSGRLTITSSGHDGILKTDDDIEITVFLPSSAKVRTQ